MELRVEDGTVHLVFPQQTKWVRLSPDQAEQIGQKILEFSRLARGSIIVPGIQTH